MKETIKRQVTIKAPASTVWKILMDNELNKEWFAEFSEGTHAVATWEVGSKVKYLDKNGSGMISTVVSNVPNEIISVEHIGMVINNEEDFESDTAKSMKGSMETYKLQENNNETVLEISVDTPAEYMDMMAEMWDRAILKINKMAEKMINI